MSRRKFVLIAASLVLALCCSAQNAKQSAGPTDPKAYVLAEFGPSLTFLPQFPAIVGDLDGDGTEDLALVVSGKNPLLDEQQFHYKTIDPYDAFFGWSDPKDTLRFSASEGDPKFLVIVQNWRAATPKSKFVVINLPFKNLSMSRYLTKKKKVVPSIELEDDTGSVSNLFWDGKQWKWADNGLKSD